MNILITGAVLPAAIGIARLFGQAGHRVVLAGSEWFATGRMSRYVSRWYQLPPPRYEPAAFSDAVRTIVERERIDMIVPCFEEIFYLAADADRAGYRDLLFCDDVSVLRALHDKYEFISRVASLGMDHPTSHRVSDPSDLRDRLAAGGDWVLKPVHSRFSENVFFNPTADTVNELDVSPESPWVLQQRIAGRQVCTYTVAHRGVITAHVAYTTLLSRGAGASVAAASIDHPAALRWVEEFVRRTEFHGQVSFDFLEAEDGTPYVIECNPRATTGAFFVSYAPGADAAFTDPEHARVEGAVPERIINRLVALLMRLENLGDRSARTRLASIDRQCKDYYFSARDPLPWLWRFVCAAGVMLQAQRTGMGIERLTTHRSQYDGGSL